MIFPVAAATEVARLAGVALLGGLALLYAASRAVMAGVVREEGEASPGRRAAGYAVPVGVCALWVAAAGRPEVGLGILMGVSVAAASLAAGVVEVLAPREARPGGFAPVMAGGGAGAANGESVLALAEDGRQERWGALWRLTLPVALLVLIVGFSGSVDYKRAVMLLVEGFVILMVWLDRSGEAGAGWAGGVGGRRMRAEGWMMVGLGIGLAVVGVVLAQRGVDLTRSRLPNLTTGVAAAAILAPGLTLAVLGDAAKLAETGRGAEARTAQVGLVAICLCLLLPAVVGLGYVMPEVWEWAGAQQMARGSVAGQGAGPASGPAATLPAAAATTMSATRAAGEEGAAAVVWEGGPTVFPMGVWRVDAVVLTVLALWLLPASLGKWGGTKVEGIFMIVLYAAYLMAVAGFHG